MRAYYIRTMECWGTRDSFAEWEEIMFQEGSGYVELLRRQPCEPPRGSKKESWSWSPEDLGHFHSYYKVYHQATPEDFDRWDGDRIASGSDEYLKAILLAHCPRLHTLTFPQPGPLFE